MSLDLVESIGELFGVPVSSLFIPREIGSADVSRQEISALKKRLALKMTRVIEDAFSEIGM